MLIPGLGKDPGFDVVSPYFDASSEVHLHSPLSFTPDVVKSRLFTVTFTTIAFRPTDVHIIQ